MLEGTPETKLAAKRIRGMIEDLQLHPSGFADTDAGAIKGLRVALSIVHGVELDVRLGRVTSELLS